jgi:molecular chaperone GrpE
MQETPDVVAAPEAGGEKPAALPEETGAPAAGASDGALAEPRPEPAPQAAPSAEELLKKAELAAQEHYDAWLRAKAEADNIRKRAQVEIANAHKFALESFAAELLPVADSLEAALAAEGASAESIKSGVELTLRQLKSVFQRFNLREIDPAGERFDPHRHQAIGTVECDAEPNTVVQVLQKGYLLHERVIRPALVTVAKPKSVEN